MAVAIGKHEVKAQLDWVEIRKNKQRCSGCVKFSDLLGGCIEKMIPGKECPGFSVFERKWVELDLDCYKEMIETPAPINGMFPARKLGSFE